MKILIVDDLPQVRRGLCMRLKLEPDFEVVGEAADGAQAIELVRKVHPDVVLMDLDIPVMDGIAATREIAGECRILVLSMADTREMTRQALAAGARSFVCKADTEGMVAAIRRLA